MKFAVFGAGAIGGYVGARLSRAGEEVSFIARGPNLAAIRARGVRLVFDDGREEVADTVRACDDVADAGPHDAILLAVKAHQVADVVERLDALCHAQTVVVTMQNGIPWWYFYRHGGALEGRLLSSVDPNGAISARIDPSRIVGSVVYPAAELVQPGVIRVIEGNRFTLGEPDGQVTERVTSLSQAFTRAGFKAPATRDIRSEIWLKLWGNLSFNPLSALTRATLAGMIDFPPTRALAAAMMREAQQVAEALGVRLRVSLEKRIEGARQVGEHKTSMLQDLEQGKPMEIEALIGAVTELGRLTAVPTPNIDAVYACVSLLARKKEAS